MSPESFTNALLITLISLIGFIGVVGIRKISELVKDVKELLLSNEKHHYEIYNLQKGLTDAELAVKEHELRIQKLEISNRHNY